MTIMMKLIIANVFPLFVAIIIFINKPIFALYMNIYEYINL